MPRMPPERRYTTTSGTILAFRRKDSRLTATKSTPSRTVPSLSLNKPGKRVFRSFSISSYHSLRMIIIR